jgi:hypothetical protein
MALALVLGVPVWFFNWDPPYGTMRERALHQLSLNGSIATPPHSTVLKARAVGFMDVDYWFEFRIPPESVKEYEATVVSAMHARGNWPIPLWFYGLHHGVDNVVESRPWWFPDAGAPGYDELEFGYYASQTPPPPNYLRAFYGGLTWYEISPGKGEVYILAYK